MLEAKDNRRSRGFKDYNKILNNNDLVFCGIMSKCMFVTRFNLNTFDRTRALENLV